jgi:nucleotide-binding universal stress UspA family protein
LPYSHILTTIDGSPSDQRVLVAAIELCKAFQARLTILAVEGPLPAYAATIGEVDEFKREKDVFFERVAKLAEERAKVEDVQVEVVVRPGHAADLIVREAGAREIDLVVIGYKGHLLQDYFIASTADRVANHASCPVLIVH